MVWEPGQQETCLGKQVAESPSPGHVLLWVPKPQASGSGHGNAYLRIIEGPEHNQEGSSFACAHMGSFPSIP